MERYAQEIASRLPSDIVREVVPRYVGGGVKGYIWEQLALPVTLQKNDVLWSPANLGPITVRRQILSLHDIASLDHPEWFAPSVTKMYRFMLPMLASRVKDIVTVSEFSRSRIISKLNISEHKVHIIHPGVSEKFFHNDASGGKHHRTLPYRYAVAYGGSDPRKNTSLIFDAWRRIAKRDLSLHLCIFGAESNLFGTHKHVTKVENIHFLGYVEDDELPKIYQGAEMLIYPSLYEGFGLPVLEAMAAGIPVIASDIPVFRELYYGSAMLVNPFDAAELAEAIELIVTNSNVHHGLVEAGRICARRYSYDSAAANLMSLYWKSV